MVLQVRLVFECLQTGESQTGESQTGERQTGERQTAHLVTHLAGEWPLVAVNSFMFFQVWSSNERFPTIITPVWFEACVDLQVL